MKRESPLERWIVAECFRRPDDSKFWQVTINGWCVGAEHKAVEPARSFARDMRRIVVRLMAEEKKHRLRLARRKP